MRPAPARHSRPLTAIVGVGLIVMTVIGGAAGCSAKSPNPPASTTSASATQEASTTDTQSGPAAQTDPLTGGRPSGHEVFAVKIDNVAAAHPQVGLDQADIVVAERVEANLTRMIAVFHTSFPSRVGPVRSARNTDLQLLGMFGKPGLIFSGANRKVLAQVKNASVVPIERSDRDRSRVAPHNVIVNVKKLAAQTSVGHAQPIGLTFAAKDRNWDSAAKQPRVKVKIGSDIFGFGYARGDFSTSWNGRTNTDGDSHKPVRTSNVIVLKVKTHRDRQTTSHLSEVSETVGSGKVTVYRDGLKRSGTWSRKSVSAPISLTDPTGQTIMLRPGHSWLLLQG